MDALSPRPKPPSICKQRLPVTRIVFLRRDENRTRNHLTHQQYGTGPKVTHGRDESSINRSVQVSSQGGEEGRQLQLSTVCNSTDEDRIRVKQELVWVRRVCLWGVFLRFTYLSQSHPPTTQRYKLWKHFDLHHQQERCGIGASGRQGTTRDTSETSRAWKSLSIRTKRHGGGVTGFIRCRVRHRKRFLCLQEACFDGQGTKKEEGRASMAASVSITELVNYTPCQLFRL